MTPEQIGNLADRIEARAKNDLDAIRLLHEAECEHLVDYVASATVRRLEAADAEGVEASAKAIIVAELRGLAVEPAERY